MPAYILSKDSSLAIDSFVISSLMTCCLSWKSSSMTDFCFYFSSSSSFLAFVTNSSFSFWCDSVISTIFCSMTALLAMYSFSF